MFIDKFHILSLKHGISIAQATNSYLIAIKRFAPPAFPKDNYSFSIGLPKLSGI